MTQLGDYDPLSSRLRGHALVAAVLPEVDPLYKVTSVPGVRWGSRRSGQKVTAATSRAPT